MEFAIKKYITVFLLSIVKIYGGIFFGVASRLHFLETAIFSALGSICTVAVALFLLNRYRPFLARVLTRLKCFYYYFVLALAKFVLSRTNYYSLKRKLVQRRKPRKFSNTIRFVVRVWRVFGVIGISILTPLMLSPIGGAVIAVSFRADYKKTMFYMIVSHILFALLFSYVFTEFGDLIEREFGINLAKQG